METVSKSGGQAVAVKEFVAHQPSVRGLKALPRKRTASVADAKAHFSTLLKDVEARRAEITLLRRGIAVARLVPVDSSGPTTGFGWMRGSAEEIADVIGPTGEEWDVHEE